MGILVDRILSLLRKDAVSTAFDLLDQVGEDTDDEESKNDLSLLRGRFYKNENSFHVKNIISPEDFELEGNKIRNALNAISELLEETYQEKNELPLLENIIANFQETEPENNDSIAHSFPWYKKVNPKVSVFSSLFVILAFVGGVLFAGDFFGDDPDEPIDEITIAVPEDTLSNHLEATNSDSLISPPNPADTVDTAASSLLTEEEAATTPTTTPKPVSPRNDPISIAKCDDCVFEEIYVCNCPDLVPGSSDKALLSLINNDASFTVTDIVDNRDIRSSLPVREISTNQSFSGSGLYFRKNGLNGSRIRLSKNFKQTLRRYYPNLSHTAKPGELFKENDFPEGYLLLKCQ